SPAEFEALSLHPAQTPAPSPSDPCVRKVSSTRAKPYLGLRQVRGTFRTLHAIPSPSPTRTPAKFKALTRRSTHTRLQALPNPCVRKATSTSMSLSWRVARGMGDGTPSQRQHQAGIRH